MELKKDLTVVLNGGKDVMASATIPVQWFFSSETADKAPTHLLIVDYTDDDLKDSLRGYCKYGIRYLIEISDAIKYLQMFKPGIHHLCFSALKVVPGDDGNEGKVRYNFLSKKDGMYRNSISVQKTSYGNVYLDLSDWSEWNRNKPCATTYVKIEVPEELFAKIPEKGFGRAIWNYVNGNLRRGEKPVDECANRKRFMWFFPLKLLFHGTFRLILGILATVLLIIAGLLTFVVGFIPNKILSTLGDLWNFNTSLKSIDEPWRTVKEYSNYGYRVLLVKKDGKEVMMPFAPWQLILGLLVLNMIMLHWQIYVARIVTLVAIVGIVIGSINVIRIISKITEMLSPFITTIGKWFASPIEKFKSAIEVMNYKRDDSRREKRRKESEEKERKAKLLEEKYVNYLKTELPAENAPEKVDINNLPKAFKGETVKKFKVAFWSFKAKVCKPYPK